MFTQHIFTVNKFRLANCSDHEVRNLVTSPENERRKVPSLFLKRTFFPGLLLFIASPCCENDLHLCG